MKTIDFQYKLLQWFDQNGRTDLPWQHPVTPYRVWVSEIMLQQTQVATVIPYFERFIHRFPDIQTLATAPLDDVLTHWAGLGYYARARNLHKTAVIIAQKNEFPQDLKTLISLPGIGLSTAGAISSIAFNHSAAILDGNVRRVLARLHAISGWTGSSSINKKLWALSHFYTPNLRVADYTQAIMDLGATICTRSQPLCLSCPFSGECKTKQQNKTNDIPTSKPKKKQPIRTIVFLILQNHYHQFFLEKRLPAGIWGGLWSFPEFKTAKLAQDWCLAHQIIIKKYQLLDTQRHTFSHYHLDYSPLFITCDNPINIRMDNRLTCWYNTAENNLALPAPIKQLLQQILERET